MCYVYILRNPQSKLYIGCTNNIDKRMSYHAAGNASKFTKQHKNFKVVYSERHETLLSAQRREQQLKKWRREKKEKLILSK